MQVPRQTPNRRGAAHPHRGRPLALRAQARLEGRHARRHPVPARPVCSRLRADTPTGLPHGAGYGVLSSHSSLRQEVVPEPAPSVDNPLLEDDSEQLALGHDDGLARGGNSTGRAAELAKRRPWAWMLRHVWQVDVSTCPRCGGAMRWVEVATAPDAIARVLAELEHPGGGDGRRVSKSAVAHPRSSFGSGSGRARRHWPTAGRRFGGHRRGAELCAHFPGRPIAPSRAGLERWCLRCSCGQRQRWRSRCGLLRRRRRERSATPGSARAVHRRFRQAARWVFRARRPRRPSARQVFRTPWTRGRR